ncbi:MAG: hypothetical protein K8R60_06555 [Burkholderiales bacterium]|nr:hypothetical protein [Burkholderiales bacterium]
MRKIIHGVLFALAAFALALPAHAGKGGGTLPPTIDKKSRNDNTVYAGINWNFGVRNGATAVLGYRDAKVKSNSNVEGWKVEATWVLSGAPMGFGEVRAKYLKGERDVQGELGLGFSGAHEAFLLNGGVQGPYINGNVDYLFNKGWLASIGANTLNKVKKPKKSESCPAGYFLQDGTCFPDD